MYRDYGYQPRPKKKSGTLNAILLILVSWGIMYYLGWQHITPDTNKLKLPSNLSSLIKNDVGNSTRSLASTAQKLQSVAPGEHSVQGPPTITEGKIATILCNAGSPACKFARDLYQDGVDANINPVYALAFFHHESTFGTRGAAIGTRSLGNLVCYSGASCSGRFASFGSWQDGFAAWYHLLNSKIYIGSGHATVESIIPIYAPASDGNNEAEYIRNVVDDVATWSN